MHGFWVDFGHDGFHRVVFWSLVGARFGGFLVLGVGEAGGFLGGVVYGGGFGYCLLLMYADNCAWGDNLV